MARQITYGAPWDEDGVDMRGNKPRERPTRPVSLTDQLRAQQEKDGFINVARDPDLPNDAERRLAQEAMYDMIDEAAADPRASGGQPVREAFNRDEVSDEFTEPHFGLSLDAKRELYAEADAYLDSLTADDHKALRKQARQIERQSDAQGAVLQDMYRRFVDMAPDFAMLDQAEIDAAAATVVESYGGVDDIYDFNDPEHRQEFVSEVVAVLRSQRKYPNPSDEPRTIGDRIVVNDGGAPGDGLGDAILDWQKRSGLF